MRIVFDPANPADPARRARVLALLLPGALQQPEAFVQDGFVRAVRERRLPLDLALPDLGLQYIGQAADGTAVLRLHDYLARALPEGGYDEVWLGGVSIGAFIALAYAARYPAMISRLCLLAPYPGSRLLTGRIVAAGGLHAWSEARCTDDDEVRVWQWLKDGGARRAPAIDLGYGRDDRFADGQRLFAQASGVNAIDVIDGGHDAPTWLRLWELFLDRMAPRLLQCAGQGAA